MDDYVKTLPVPVHVERMGKRSGLIRARLRGKQCNLLLFLQSSQTTSTLLVVDFIIVVATSVFYVRAVPLSSLSATDHHRLSLTHQCYLAILPERLAQGFYRVAILSEPRPLALCVTRSVLNWPLWCTNYVTFYTNVIRSGL